MFPFFLPPNHQAPSLFFLSHFPFTLYLGVTWLLFLKLLISNLPDVHSVKSNELCRKDLVLAFWQQHLTVSLENLSASFLWSDGSIKYGLTFVRAKGWPMWLCPGRKLAENELASWTHVILKSCCTWPFQGFITLSCFASVILPSIYINKFPFPGEVSQRQFLLVMTKEKLVLQVNT